MRSWSVGCGIDLVRRGARGRRESLESVKRFIGEDHEAAHVPAEARTVLSQFEARAAHYKVLARRPQGG